MSALIVALRPTVIRLAGRKYSNSTNGASLASLDTTTPTTHFRVTLRRSAIGLPSRIRATLISMGIHRRMQTVFLPHTGQAAGKILKVKELVEVENVTPEQVKSKTERRLERKAVRGYRLVSTSRLNDGLVS